MTEEEDVKALLVLHQSLHLNEMVQDKLSAKEQMLHDANFYRGKSKKEVFKSSQSVVNSSRAVVDVLKSLKNRELQCSDVSGRTFAYKEFKQRLTSADDGYESAGRYSTNSESSALSMRSGSTQSS